MGQSSFRNRGGGQVGIFNEDRHRQRGAAMCRITAGGHASSVRIDPNGCLLEWYTPFDKRQDPRDGRSGIERPIPPPFKISGPDVGYVQTSPAQQTLGKAQSHPDRATDLVSCCQPKQHADHSLLPIVHQSPIPVRHNAGAHLLPEAGATQERTR